MGYIRGANRNQVILFPDALDDYVETDNEVRVIDAFIDSLSMGKLGYKDEPAKEGRPGYDPRDMLKLYVYGYLNHIRSSRRLQKEAGRNVELMWLLKKVVPDFRCISDFRKDNAKAVKEVFKSFVKLCDKAELLSHESVVIDGSKFRAVNADNKSYVSSNVSKVLKDVDEKIEQYMQEMDECDEAEAKPGALEKEDISGILDYLERRKKQLTDALAQIETSGGNQVCTTDPECRLMKTRDGIRPSFNVQTAVESENHIIVHYDVTDECVDWNLLQEGIEGAKKALGVENIEGIADRGYSNGDEIFQCLLNGDTPTTYPNKGEECRIFRFRKTDGDITEEMLTSNDKEAMMKCVSAGVLPEVLKRDDIEMEIYKRRESGSGLYLNKGTGELVSYAEMRNAGGLEQEKVDVKREEPLQKYFERDIEKDTVTCPMGQTLFYAGPGQPNGKKAPTIRRYHRASACSKCKNKCTMGKRRIVSFKEGETQIDETFYDRCRDGKIYRRTNHTFKYLQLTEEESSWEEWVIIRFYPNYRHLRKRNTIVEHPYGTVKRWHGASYLLTKGKLTAAAETGLSFLAYNFRRAMNILGTNKMMELIRA